jgi:hypothetical protein
MSDARAVDIVIDVHGINKHFGENRVVKDLPLTVRRGEIFGFLGPNGSGKTTSIRMLCGLLTPDSGEGTCLGYDIVREAKQIKRHVGYMTQRFSKLDGSQTGAGGRLHPPDARRGRSASHGNSLMGEYFSISRWFGIVGKEFIQLKRDQLTFGMIVGIPIIQLTLFGFAINSDPKHLPTTALVADDSQFSRSILAALRNSDYFAFIGEARSESEADSMLATGQAQFRGQHPRRLLQAPGPRRASGAADRGRRHRSHGDRQRDCGRQSAHANGPRARSDRAAGRPRADSGSLRGAYPSTLQS